MQNITIDNKIYKLPTSWDEVTFLQFVRLTNYVQTIDQDDYDNYSDDLFYSNILTALLDVPRRSYMELSLADKNIYLNTITFVTTPLKEVPYSKDIIHGNLVIKVKDFSGLKYGEYIDLIAQNTNDLGLIKLLSLLCDVYAKKDIKKLRFKDKKLDFTNERKEAIISQLPATHAKAITNFFLLGQQQLGRNTASFLNKLALRLAMKSLLQTVGLIIYGLWMRVVKTLLSLVMLLTFRLDKCSRIWHTKLPRII